MLKHRCPDELGTDCFADYRSGAVTTNEIRAVDRNPLSAIEVVGNCRDTLLVLGDFIDFSAIEDANARLRCHVCEQHWLEELLIDPVSVFRRWPEFRPRCSGASLASSWNPNA